MATIEDIKKIFTVGEEFAAYYGNGERRKGYNSDGSRYNIIEVVSRISDKSCWLKDPVDNVESRQSWNSILNDFTNGLYRLRDEECPDL